MQRDADTVADADADTATIAAAAGTADTRSVEITFVTNAGKTVRAPANSNLLRVSLREQAGIPFKCGGGICGTCKCRIERGLEHTDAVKPKERKHLNDDDLRAGYRMACQTFVNGDIAVSWQPKP
ncbi:2Fe-2S iron-sulfur cluster-binding protein [Cupriavidus campinensis]